MVGVGGQGHDRTVLPRGDPYILALPVVACFWAIQPIVEYRRSGNGYIG
jgi:hypothetical protein